MLKEKICLYCTRKYLGFHNQKFCSWTCGENYHKEKKKNKKEFIINDEEQYITDPKQAEERSRKIIKEYDEFYKNNKI